MMMTGLLKRGFALPLALFYVVIIGSALGYMTNMQSTQTVTNTLAIQKVRADLAADAGYEWAAAKKRTGNACSGASPLFTYENEITVNVTLNEHTHTEDGTDLKLCDVSSTATFLSSSDIGYVHQARTDIVYSEVQL